MRMQLNAAQMDRACGVLLGAAAGDALGAGYEFGVATLGDAAPAMIGGGLGGFAPGEWTDDTSMTWAVAEVAARGLDLRTEEALDAIARHFRDWYDSGPADIGNQTSWVLGAAGPAPTGARMADAALRLHERTGRSGGNGSLMRTAPVALAHLDDPAALVEAAMNVSALTHYDPDAQEACALWCLGIRTAVLDGVLDLRPGLAYLPESSQQRWAERIAEAETAHPGTFTPNGWVVTALQAAWAAVTQTPEVTAGHACGHLTAALETAIKIGDDTDTVASIAGAMLGARWGMSAVPTEWRRILHGYPGKRARDLEWLAVLAARRGQPSAYGWPLVDHIDYDTLYGRSTVAVHPHDSGVLIGGASVLGELPEETDAVVSLCLTGRTHVPAHVEHIGFRLMDEPAPVANPNLDYVLEEAARLIVRLRDEGKRVALHCVAAHSRTPTVAVAYAMLRGVPLAEAMPAVCAALPDARPNAGFRAALRRLEARLNGTGGDETGGR